jgi:predicted acetyltransferase
MLKKQATELYRLCFPEDPAEFAENLTEKHFDGCCRYLLSDGRIVSMLYLFDGRIYTEDDVLQAKYIYAAATHPDYRGRGFMSRLLEQVICEAEEQGEVLILKPATESLFGYYGRSGFKTVFYNIEGKAFAELEHKTLPQYLEKREELLKDIPHFSFSTLYEDIFANHVLKVGDKGCIALSDDNTVTEEIHLNSEFTTPFAMALPPNGVTLPDKMYMGPAWE